MAFVRSQSAVRSNAAWSHIPTLSRNIPGQRNGGHRRGDNYLSILMVVASFCKRRRSRGIKRLAIVCTRDGMVARFLSLWRRGDIQGSFQIPISRRGLRLLVKVRNRNI